MASAARTANRVVAVTKGEAENSTDVDFKAKLDSSSSAVTSGKGALSNTSLSRVDVHIGEHLHTNLI